MKIVKTKAELCIQCHECEMVCAKLYYKEDNPEKSAIRILEDKDGKVIIRVCDQCGECIEVCPTEALSRGKNDIVRLTKDKCVGCFSCVGFCPNEAMFDQETPVIPIKCISCGACVKVCHTGAIYMEEK
jgi:Fe-S-cluster-containing hydrogenase component 2